MSVSFGEGLTVLTGETGAGKSLVVDALSLLSGDRADSSLIREGSERLSVEGAFEADDGAVSAALDDAGLGTEDSGVVVKREVARGGKARLFLNGSPAPLKTLQEIAPRLLVLYGQAEARELLDPTAPRDLLDRFAGLSEPLAKTAELFRAYRAAADDRERLQAAAKGRAERLQLLELQLEELDAVKPRVGEDETLASEKAVLSNVEKVGRLLAEAATALESEDGGALAAVTAARRSFLSLQEIDAAYKARVDEATDLTERLSDLAQSAARELDRVQADPERLAEVSARLDALTRLKRKYGASLAEVVARREALGKERDQLSDFEGSLKKAEKAEQAALDAYRKAALELSALRSAAAPRLSKATEAHLKDLAFLKASFKVELSRRADAESPLEAGGERIAFGATGIDQVTLAFAPNPGEPPRPLSKIASGGELSRVQLALAAALGETAGTKGAARTFVFDEVDAGVSGATAEAVGRKLRGLATREQVLVVTHLPQVAAAGAQHLFVSKESAGGRTRTRVTALDDKGRVEAIAAMLAGSSVGDAARAQARQLLAAYRK